MTVKEERLRSKLVEVWGPDTGETLMICLHPGGRQTVSIDAWERLRRRSMELLGDECGDTLVQLLLEV